jgi:imidazolonepropionase
MAKYLLINAGKILQTRTWNKGFIKGKAMQQLPCIDHAYMLVEGELISEIGNMSDCPFPQDATTIDLKGNWIFPGLVDSHTHIVFAKSREQEFVQRIKGTSYEEIAASGGGILNSAGVLQDMPEELLFQSAFERLMEMTKSGTTTVEIKSGYGLSLESELKMLRVIKKLKNSWPGEIKATFLGAHAIPTEYKTNRNKYIDLIISEMLPAVVEENLADYCDVFCDHGFFTPEETDIILEAAWKYGLKPKIHANELGISGGVQAGIRNNAISVDHLECLGDEEIELLKHSQTIGTVLPQTSFYLGIPYAAARQMIDHGLGIAMATDYNPGSAPGGSLLFALSLGCIQMKMLPEEGLNAITINAAYALELEHLLGSLAINKHASFFITPALSSLAELPYYFSRNPILDVWIKGNLMVI